MADRRPGPDHDRILVAQLTGTARHHARWRGLTPDEEAAAVAELRELAAGRGDLLAEVAGILEGASEGQPGEPVARQAARLCRQAGADPESIPAWIQEGRRRRAAASRPPFSGGLHSTAAPPGRPPHPGLIARELVCPAGILRSRLPAIDGPDRRARPSRGGEDWRDPRGPERVLGPLPAAFPRR